MVVKINTEHHVLSPERMLSLKTCDSDDERPAGADRKWRQKKPRNSNFDQTPVDNLRGGLSLWTQELMIGHSKTFTSQDPHDRTRKI